MFFHVFKYRIKINLFDKGTMFWTLIFPMLLATLFYLAFGQLGVRETFAPIDTAIVDTADDENFVSLVKSLSSGDDRLLNISLVGGEEALKMLSEGKVQGIIETGEPPMLTVSRSGISQSILKTFLDAYVQSAASIARIASYNPEAIREAVEMLAADSVFIEKRPLGRNNPDTSLIYFYSLFAMTCLFGGFIGGNEVNAIQANLTMHAARISFAPVHKLKMIASGLAAAFVVQSVKLLLALAYMIFILSIDFGDRIGLIMLTLPLCALFGITIGALITSAVKGEEGLKNGILIGFANVSSFLAGMMNAEIKHLVDSAVPFLTRVNPASLITDAFYSLYFFDTYERYTQNIVSMLILTVVLSFATYLVLRRRKYVSI